MTDADFLRQELSDAAQLAERVQRAALLYEEAIQELRQAALLLDVRHSNAFSRSIGRMAPMIGHELHADKEITGQIWTELNTWRRHV